MQVVFINTFTFCEVNNEMFLFLIFENKRRTGYDINVAK